jgi:superoxide dismutase, Fe-Mn family
MQMITRDMKFELPNLPYETSALEPNLSRRAIEFHYWNHNQAYLTNLSTLTEGTRYENMDLETIIKLAEGPIFNNASQVWNHIFYFESLKPAGKVEIKGTFADAIKTNFGSLSLLKECFIKASLSLFGSGWIWLIWNPKGNLEVVQESNAGNPLRKGLIPLLVCDLWEHSYYLDYQNRRSDYLKAFWSIINWEIIEKRFQNVRK